MEHSSAVFGKVKMKIQRIDYIFKRKAVDIQRDEVIISSSEPEQVHENSRIEENESRPSKVHCSESIIDDFKSLGKRKVHL
ncbi:hypothetical protein MTR_7g053560 [Medicago truncatula]|uniref:Uncharacterized protein n=1 Tax=Medicago truncatula TaxID=3880 RepID=A0A072U090_MEDTR|nr:hypothetical protein MTR_7g053560 [Medicago truncatula]